MGFLSKGYFLFCPGLNWACSLIFQRTQFPIAERCQTTSGIFSSFVSVPCPHPIYCQRGTVQTKHDCLTVVVAPKTNERGKKSQGAHGVSVEPPIPSDGQTYM